MREWTGHVTPEWLEAFQQEKLDKEELMQFFTHIGSCSHCADQFAAYIEADLQEPPAYLHEEILERSQGISVQAARTVYRTSKKMRLFWYSLKVGAAVVVSLLLLFASPVAEERSIQLKEHYWEASPSSEWGEKMDGVWQEFTGWIWHPGEKEESYD